MITLTSEGIRLLNELSERERSISGNKSPEGLKRLIEAGYVVAEAVTRGDPSRIKYRITDAGREALRAAEAP
jgi:hypothetical protein